MPRTAIFAIVDTDNTTVIRRGIFLVCKQGKHFPKTTAKSHELWNPDMGTNWTFHKLSRSHHLFKKYRA